MSHSCLRINRPIATRVFSSHFKPHYTALNSGDGRPTNYKKYNADQLYAAYQEVIHNGVDIRKAALQYGVPTSTLSDRVSGRVPFGKKSGPSRYLTDDEEIELVRFVTGAAEVGYSYSRRDVINLVEEVLYRKGVTDANVSHGWWEAFRRRHPEISLRKPEPLSRARLNGAHPTLLRNYFEELESTLNDNDIMNKPSLMFNMDECGFPLDPKSPLIVCRRGQKHPSAFSSGNKSQVTVLACCNAAGHVIPPFVIFNGKILKADLTNGEVPETMYGLSSSGWIDNELFDAWFQNHFLAYAPATRPLILILDGHSSHYNPATLSRAAKEDVVLSSRVLTSTENLKKIEEKKKKKEEELLAKERRKQEREAKRQLKLKSQETKGKKTKVREDEESQSILRDLDDLLDITANETAGGARQKTCLTNDDESTRSTRGRGTRGRGTSTSTVNGFTNDDESARSTRGRGRSSDQQSFYLTR